MLAEPQGAAETGPGPLAGPAAGCRGWFGQEAPQMAAHRDRTDARAAAAVRDAERLVQVQVRDVGAELARLGEADERVEVRAVDVDLAAGLVHEPADLAHRALVHAVRRGVGDHQRRDVLGVLGELRAQVAEVDVAELVARHHDHAHAGHDGARGVGAVGARRDQADVALNVAALAVVPADREQPGELSLRAGVRLQRDGVVAGDRAQPALEVADQRDVPVGLVERRERVDRRELGPRHGLHLGRRVELHRAGAERDHRAVERDVAPRERAEIAQHLRLGAVRAEDRVREEVRGARELRRNRIGRVGVEGIDVARHPERAPEALHLRALRDLVARDADRVRIDAQEVDVELTRGRDDGVRVVRDAHADGVEVGVVHELVPALAEPAGEDRRQPVHAARDQLEPLAAVVDGVHRGHHGEQHLRRADVRRGLLAADVLLAGLQREAQRRIAVGVDRDADEAARQRALETGADAHVGRVRAAEADRDAEPLRRADDDVGAHLARRLEQHEREQVGGDARERALGVRGLGERREIAHAAARARVLREHAEAPALGQPVADVGHDDLDAERLGARLQRRERLREDVGIDDERLDVAFETRRATVIASAAAVASSSSEAFASGRPVRSQIIVW